MYQNTLFPAPATKHNIHQFLRKHNGCPATDVSHGSIEENPVQTISIVRRFRLERTMLRSPRGAIRRRCDGFSMDQVERATLG